MHPPCAEVGKCVHLKFKSCAHRLRYTLNIRENGAHAGCTAFETHAPGIKVMNAGCSVHP